MLPYYNGGECIEIAKGKFATIKTVKQLKKQIKRDFKTKFK
jgi:hypothetical protein